jgi:hypothetical protein
LYYPAGFGFGIVMDAIPFSQRVANLSGLNERAGDLFTHAFHFFERIDGCRRSLRCRSRCGGKYQSHEQRHQSNSQNTDGTIMAMAARSQAIPRCAAQKKGDTGVPP